MELEEITKKLEPLNPLSVILYGSRARTDFLETSDYELGVLFKREEGITFSDIKEVVDEKGVNIYPFVYEDFLNGRIDTPFQKRIYLRELITSGKTLLGERVIKEMRPPVIKILDAIEDLRFNTGYGLASLQSFRNGDQKSAKLLFYKSCLFATRNLIMAELGEFPIEYNSIANFSESLDLNPYKELVRKAYRIRKNYNSEKLDQKDIVLEVTYMNKFIEPLLRELYERDKNMKLIH